MRECVHTWGQRVYMHARVMTLICALGWVAIRAGFAESTLPDPVLEARARVLFMEVRCVVCQGQSIADSNAELAGEMRLIIREQLRNGRTDKEIFGFLRDRYGDFVLLRPPLTAKTVLLWGAPFLVLCLGIILVAHYYRQLARQDQFLSSSDHERLQGDATHAEKRP